LKKRRALALMKNSISKIIIVLLGLAVVLVVLGFQYQYYLEGRLSVLDRSFIVYTFVFIVLVAVALTLVLTNRLLLIADQDHLVEKQNYQNEKLWEMNQVIRTERHDFVNHLQTVYGLIQLGLPDEAQAFISELYTELQASGEAMRLALPELSALLLAKTGFAARKNISFKMEVSSDLSSINIRPFDLVTITGNLINNALEAVENLPPADRQVHFAVYENSRFFVIQTRNPGFIPPDLRADIFTPGISTKHGESHRGLGLASIKALTDNYGGFVVVSSHLSGTRFTVGFPKQSQEKLV
jgi:two-component system, LytTR family, sensor histidine kinase AgrC